MADDITAADLAALTAWDTPTICNALEIVAPERRLTGFTIENMVCLDPAMKPICGRARTGTIRASHAPAMSGAAVRETRARYYEYQSTGPKPTVTVLQDLDPNPGVGAFWGEVNTAVHKALGSLGAVTNGSIRDLDACAPGFALVAGKVGPSHAQVHVVDFGGQVNVFGMVVCHDDIVHADRHGAVVVPATVVKQIPAACGLLERREAVILEVARGADFTFAKLEAAMARQSEIH